MNETCCPQYTIRLDVDQFKISKSQKQVLSTFLRFLKSGAKTEKIECSDSSNNNGKAPNSKRARAGAVVNQSEPRNDRSRKKKEIRRERAIDKLNKKGVNIKEYQKDRFERERKREKSLESLFAEIINHKKTTGTGHTFHTHTLKVNSSEFNSFAEESEALYMKYQSLVHKDNDRSKTNWKDFLVTTPIGYQFMNKSFEELPYVDKYGTYHQNYFLDDKLIAVGVLDVLPTLVSAKYFYYDPDYSFCNMGIFSALHEIYTIKKMHLLLKRLQYYYMGYFIYNCPKMRYKAKFEPSELLCDTSFKWMACSEAIEKIAENDGRFTSFYDSEEVPTININNLNLKICKKAFDRTFLIGVTWEVLQRHRNYCNIDNDKFKRNFQEFVNRIGEMAYSIKIHLPQLG
uniref:Arginyl-tRNA--protein transferase 1 n=1 Tax=Rhabditophanes sp. KR3021 TaxID=114890 RepID=A0AC35U6S4_9BILA